MFVGVAKKLQSQARRIAAKLTELLKAASKDGRTVTLVTERYASTLLSKANGYVRSDRYWADGAK
jgi:hypothetical protein